MWTMVDGVCQDWGGLCGSKAVQGTSQVIWCQEEEEKITKLSQKSWQGQKDLMTTIILTHMYLCTLIFYVELLDLLYVLFVVENTIY